MFGKTNQIFKKLVYGGIVASVFLACAAGKAMSAPDSNSIVIDDIEFYVETDKSIYYLGENVQMLYRLTKLGFPSATIPCYQAPPLNLVVLKDGKTVWMKVQNWWQWVGDLQLFPKIPVEITSCWEMNDLNDVPVEPGIYDVLGVIYTGIEIPDVGVQITILPEPRTITVGLGAGYDFNTIQAAINDANDGDTIIVADGTYTGDGNRDIEFLGKAITLRSENGPENCIIDCNGTEEEPHRGFNFLNGEDSNSVLDGFTIRNGYDQVAGGGILCSLASSPTISNCIITNNRAKDDGGGIMCSVVSPIISNCIITRNIAEVWWGGGIMCRSCKGATLDNCIITENSAACGGGIGSSGDNFTRFGDIIVTNCTFSDNIAQYGGAVYVCDGSKPSMVNCILWGDTAMYGPEIALTSMWPVAYLYVSFSNVQGGEADVYDDGDLYWEPGNIDADPCFADPCNGDYHLKSQAGRFDANSLSWVPDDVTSPAIDTGDPASPIGHEPFPNGGRINMGAYGGMVEASKSYFGLPLCETIVAGDINGDCKINFLDFRLMALHWLRDENQ